MLRKAKAKAKPKEREKGNEVEVIKEVGRRRAAKEINGSLQTKAGAKAKAAMVVVSLST